MAEEPGSNGDALALPVGKEAVDPLIKENSHIFTDTQCISESQELAQDQSKKQASKVRRCTSIHGEEELSQSKKIKLDTKQQGNNGEDRNKYCPICTMTFTSPVVANSHYVGKTHAKNLKLHSPKAEAVVPAQKQAANAPPTTVSSNEENQNTSDPNKFCSLCHAIFNNPLMAKQHYVGKKHKKQETKLKLMAHYGRTPEEPAASTALQAKCPARRAPQLEEEEVSQEERPVAAEPPHAEEMPLAEGDERQIESPPSFRQVTDSLESMRGQIMKTLEAFDVRLKALEDKMVSVNERLERLEGGDQNQ
ncbi:PREDICTED: zinc finger protein 346-like [Gekko japonicus]|uniref:Zinc finger protein 346 n=1 Tax=Gekko japonicus TaxID=146911 RepID=A0ABM1K2S0_GEKJA|nr:PREDICTED: zinc finger protein 346-like [Gekko japonicus]